MRGAIGWRVIREPPLLRDLNAIKRDLTLRFPSLPDPSLPLICFLALVLYRVMCMRLKASGSSVSPRTALELLRRIQKHSATIGERAYTGISKTTPEQLDLFAAMSLPKP